LAMSVHCWLHFEKQLHTTYCYYYYT
jgi:hypothetical protein